MPTLTLKEYTVLDPGEYLAKISGITETTGQWGDQFKFEFTLLDEQGKPTDNLLSAWCSQKYSGGSKPSKLYTWAVAMLGEAPYEFDPVADLLGKTCFLTVVIDAKDGKEYNRIHSLRAARRATPQQPRPAAQVAQAAPVPQAAPRAPYIPKNAAAVPPPPIDDNEWEKVYAQGEPAEDVNVW